ncbi:hypothetical protein HYR99_02555 [Candidatus Poribacteria bacterium]|nr:hypothetical protein [Candidatus Poribacteria bacterium]
MKEKGVYDPDAQKRASALFAQAAAMPRLDDVLSKAVPFEALAAEQQRYEVLVDNGLWQAAITAHDGRDEAAARSHLEKMVQQNQTADLKAKAQEWLNALNQMQPQPGGER